MLSLGFICDLTLCTSCTETWNNKIGGDVLNIDTWTPDYLWNSVGFKSMSAKGAEGSTSGIDAINSVNADKYSVDPAEYWAGTSQIRFPFDPRKNFWVALICWPPCIPTIIRTLEMVKRVLVAQNTCMNKAYLLGEDIEDCPNLGWRLFCILTFGQFMHVLPDMLRQYVTKTVSSLLSRAFELGCTAKNEAAAMYCTGVRIKHSIVGVLSILDLVTNIQQLVDEMDSAFDWGDSEDDDDSVDDEYSARAEEYGTLPSY